MHRTSSIVACCGLMLATLVTAQPAYTAPAPAPDCRVSAPAPAPEAAQAADGSTALTQWLDADGARAANVAVQQAADRATGAPAGKERIADRLRRGVIGTAIDHGTRTSWLVVTPEQRGRVKALGGSLTAAAAAAAATSAADAATGLTGADPTATGLTAGVKVGCFPAQTLIAADDLLFARAWHPDAAKATFGYHLDAADSRFHVGFDPAYPDAAQALRDALGDLVEVTLEQAGPTGRLNDGEPHFGGAGLREGSGATNTCSSGFIVRRNSTGAKLGTTAGHCFDNGDSIYSSTQYWGTGQTKAPYPTYDMMLVGSTAETYDNKIHTDPCCPTERFVTARRGPVIGDAVCLSGMVTKATCGVLVTDLDSVVCVPSGCTTGLMRGSRNGQIIVKPGDSGGPVYLRSGTSNATALAMIVGRIGDTVVLAETIDNIEIALGVTVLTY